jgi:hypothetical protein
MNVRLRKFCSQASSRSIFDSEFPGADQLCTK